MQTAKHFGSLLVGQDFRLTPSGEGVVFRRLTGLHAKRVDCIGGHQDYYTGSEIPMNRNTVVYPVN